MPKSKLQRQRIDAERAAILAFLDDGDRHTFREICTATGMTDSVATNRIGWLRREGLVQYVERNAADVGVYQKAAAPGEVILPASMRDYPPLYLKMGGWACPGVAA